MAFVVVAVNLSLETECCRLTQIAGVPHAGSGGKFPGIGGCVGIVYVLYRASRKRGYPCSQLATAPGITYTLLNMRFMSSLFPDALAHVNSSLQPEVTP